MEKHELNKFLPFGTSLKEVLNHPSINSAKIKSLLKTRGIYLNNANDNLTYPILLSTILSPSEFDEVVEKIKTKEDGKKIITRTVEWNSESDLVNSIPSYLNLGRIAQSNNFRPKIINNSNFAMVDNNRNRLKMTFKCQTNNYNSNYYRNKNEFEGEIIIEKKEISDKVFIEIIHTSSETLEIADLGVKEIINICKEKNYLKSNAELKKIRYKDFNNEERINFFLMLTGGNDTFEFIRAVDIDISPDNKTSLNSELSKIMTGGVSGMKMSGEELHRNFIIQDPNNHPFIQLATIEALFKFDFQGSKGNCNISFGFQDFFKKRNENTEFSINLLSLSIDQDNGANSKSRLKQKLLHQFEKFKTEVYDNFKSAH